MNIQRVITFCEKKIKKEREKNSMFSSDMIVAYEQVLDFIKNADKPKDNEPEQVEEIFSKHYSSYMLMLTGKEKKYTFNDSEKKIIKTKLIPTMKMEMANNVEQFGEATVGDFFELFILNMSDFWKKTCFNVSGINKHFARIYHEGLHRGKNINGNQVKKIANSALIGREYTEPKDYTVHHD